MTSPNPDAELDAALGVDRLPPATVTDLHRALALAALYPFGPEPTQSSREAAVAQAIAEAEQRGAARVIAEHKAAGT